MELELPQPLFSQRMLDPGVLHCNHAAVAPWPRAVVEAVESFARENGRQGSRRYLQWLEVEARLRQRLAQLINAPHVDTISLLKNTSEALSVVAWGLDWQPGDSIVTSDEEFPSNRIVWESLAELGVELRQISLAAEDPEGALLDAMDGSTRLLAISSVQYASGRRLDMERLGHACSDRDVLFCIDAIQQLGALRLDVQACRADFVAADGHKWLLGPEGVALFYCRAELRDRLHLHQFGWHMTDHPGEFDRKAWQPALCGRRFECGSPNQLGIHALDAAVGVLLETGMEAIERAVLARSGYLLEQLLQDNEVELITPFDSAHRAGIVTFRLKSMEATQAAYEQLQRHGVLCALRGGGIRLSPHAWTTQDELDAVLALIA